jgi:hypothetical protein
MRRSAATLGLSHRVDLVTDAKPTDILSPRAQMQLQQLPQALTGYFDDHHAFLYATMLPRIDTTRCAPKRDTI